MTVPAHGFDCHLDKYMQQPCKLSSKMLRTLVLAEHLDMSRSALCMGAVFARGPILGIWATVTQSRLSLAEPSFSSSK
jgi:hypothetical protein